MMEWQVMSLTEEMRKKPESSEVQVFNDFIVTLTGLQKKLYIGYQHDRYLRDRQLTGICMPPIQEVLRDRMPRYAQ